MLVRLRGYLLKLAIINSLYIILHFLIIIGYFETGSWKQLDYIGGGSGGAPSKIFSGDAP